MRIGWLADEAPYQGGAELTQAELRAAAPDTVEIVDCRPGAVDGDCERYAVHNCLSYSLEDLQAIAHRPVVKYWNDTGPWLKPEVRALLDEHAIAVCCSPLQAEHMGLSGSFLIPPPINLERFERAGARVNGHRSGLVSAGSWQNFGKAPHRAAEWAAAQGLGLDFYGEGPFAPEGSWPVSYEEMPVLLAHYRTFVFLPTVLEPFGRTVVEAWAAGCELIINELVGAKWWIRERPDALETAAADYWGVLLR